MCAKIDKEFEEFFLHCQIITNSDQKEIDKIIKPLKVFLRWQQVTKCLKVISVLATICCAIYYVDSLNWYFCAAGRLIMIKLLPIWNWTYLHNAKCLVAKTAGTPSASPSRTFNEKDCRACEHFGKFFSDSKSFSLSVTFQNICRHNRHTRASKLQLHTR